MISFDPPLGAYLLAAAVMCIPAVVVALGAAVVLHIPKKKKAGALLPA